MFPRVLQYFSLSMQNILPPNIKLLSQPSKTGPFPHNYIAILGDSYAAGAGDWHGLADPNSNPIFSAAGVLHTKIGRDIVSMGTPGAGSVDGLLINPLKILKEANLTITINVEKPAHAFLFFFEGNDLHDNLLFIHNHFLKNHTTDKILDVATFDRFLESTLKRELKISGGLRFKLPLLQSAINTFAQLIAGPQKKYQQQFTELNSFHGIARGEPMPINYLINWKEIFISGKVHIGEEFVPSAWSEPHAFAPRTFF